MAISAKTTGRLERLSALRPHLTERTELRLTHLAYRELAADALAMQVHSDGDVEHHQVEAELRLENARASGKPLAASHAALSVEVHRRAPSISMKLALDGMAHASVTAALSVEGHQHTLRYDVDADANELSGLSALGDEGSEWDLEKLEVSLHAHGRLGGLISSLPRDGAPRMAPDLFSSLDGEGTQDLHVGGLSWSSEDSELTVPSLTWHAEMKTVVRHRTVEGTLELSGLELDTAEHHVAVHRLHEAFSGSIDGPETKQRWDLSQRLTSDGVQQDYAPGYALNGASVTLDLHRTGDHTLHVTALRFENPAAGTRLNVSGNVDVGGSPQRMSLRGELEQNLARVWTDTQTFSGSGNLGATFRVDSPDLRVFRTESALRFEQLQLVSARNGVVVEGLNGELPISADFISRGNKLVLLRDTNTNPYWMLRFADQHPLLGHPSFISARRIVTPLVIMTGMAGNLKIDQNILSLNQLEVGVRGGRISGQCTVNLRGADTKLQATIRATHVLSSHGEPFDGNAALAISMRQRTVDGRMQVLKIGKRHLLDLLDLQDPQRADSGINRIRSAMAFGYPDQVRVVSEHGFANVRVTLGGLAQFVKVGELRGIPVGPFVDRVMDKLFANAQQRRGEAP